MTLKNIWILTKAAASSWVDDYAQSMGAALAYYTMFSIAPLLLIVISVAGLIFGVEAARGEIVGQLQGLMGQQGAAAVQGLLESASKPAGASAPRWSGEFCCLSVRHRCSPNCRMRLIAYGAHPRDKRVESGVCYARACCLSA